MLGLEQRHRVDGIPQSSGHQQRLRIGRVAQDAAAQLQGERMVVRGAGMLVLIERAGARRRFYLGCSDPVGERPSTRTAAP